MNHSEIQAEVDQIKSRIAQLAKDRVDDEVMVEAQEQLAALKAASRRVLEHEEGSLDGMVARNVEVWREYKARHRRILAFLESLI